MCGSLWVASDNDLAIFEWDYQQEDNGVSVQKIDEPLPELRRVLSKPFLYAVNSKLTADACGFRSPAPHGQKTRAALVEFLRMVLANASYVECFEWSDNNPLATPIGKDWIGPSDLLTWRDFIVPDELLIVIRED